MAKQVNGGFVDAAVAGAADAAPAAPAAAAAGGPMRWNNNSSGFVLRRMAQMLSDSSRPDKVFKEKDVNYVAKALKDYSGDIVSPTQVYNHLRKWRQKWARVTKLKELSGALWDNDTNAIMLDQDHYLSHCKDHPKDAEYLNCPIRFYVEMEAIFGHSMATGRFAVGSGSPLGVNQADSQAAKVEGDSQVDVKSKTERGEGSKATAIQSQDVVGNKRKRGTFTEDEMLMITNMSDAVRDVAAALKETGASHVDPDLYLAVMDMPGFTTEALIVAYTYLLENKALATGFVKMESNHRDIWMRSYLAKNYFM